MGRIINFEAFRDTGAEKRNAHQKRLRAIAGVLILTLAARVVFKNPPPPKAPDHRAFRAIPGVLNSLSETERKKLSPTQLAMLQEADRNTASVSSKQTSPTMLAEKTNEKLSTPDAHQFSYKTREEERWRPTVAKTNSGKNTVVVFRRGGHILAEKAENADRQVDIRLDSTMQARLPRDSVLQIISDASNWKQKVPIGHVELKPAKGITVVVDSRIARRITISKKEEKVAS